MSSRSLDPHSLKEAQRLLEQQLDLADDDQAWNEIDTAIQALRRATARAELARLERAPRLPPLTRLPVPERMVVEMLTTGAAMWVANLIGWPRSTLNHIRDTHGIESRGRGGNPSPEGTLARLLWENQWIDRLRAAGLWQNG